MRTRTCKDPCSEEDSDVSDQMRPTATSGARRAQKAVEFSCVFFFFLLLGHVAATQYLASIVVYDPIFLGEHLRAYPPSRFKLYLPHKIYGWILLHRDTPLRQYILHSVGILLGSGVVSALLGALALKVKYARHTILNPHGSARWASRREIKESGLMEPVLTRLRGYNRGKRSFQECHVVVVGKYNGKVLYDSGDAHVLAFAPTRSGKGVGLVVPTLLSWFGSTVVLDVKGENYRLTSPWRAMINDIICFTPTSYGGHRFNPLDELERGKASIPRAMALANLLCENPEGKVDPFWSGGAIDVVTHLILYVIHASETPTLGECFRLSQNVATMCEVMCAVELPEHPYIQELLTGFARGLLKESDQVRSGWTAGAKRALDLWKDPVVDEATSGSDFAIEQLQYGERPVSVYLVIPPGEIARLTPLVRLLIGMITDRLTEREHVGEPGGRHRTLFMCDEFAAFGKMEKVEKALPYAASYGVRYYLITQDLNQLERYYGRNESILAGCHTRIAYRCNDDRTAARLVKLVGKTTAEKTQRGKSGKGFLMLDGKQKSDAYIQYERDLITAGEFMTLPHDKVIVLRSGDFPILADKVRYYLDRDFAGRWGNTDLPTAPAPKDNASKIYMGQPSTSKTTPGVNTEEKPPGDEHTRELNSDLDEQPIACTQHESRDATEEDEGEEVQSFLFAPKPSSP